MVELVGRREERRALRDVLEAVRAGRSKALVVSGEAGIGKTVLLDELAHNASGVEVIRITGVESEIEFTYSGIHQLCRSLSRTCMPGRRSASHPTIAGANIAIITPSMAADSVGETTMQAVPTTTRPRPIAR